MEDSILKSTKKALGLAADYPVFDPDVIMHINSTFSTLNQLGVGNGAGFTIEDDAPTWSDFMGDDKRLSLVKSYVYAKVRLIFDPPSSSFVVTAMEKQIQEFEWRINVAAESISFVEPVEVIDGGSV